MSRHSFWMSLTLITSAACLVNAQSFEREVSIGQDLYSQQRAIKLGASRLWIYSADNHTLECLDLSGNLLLKVELGKTTEIPLSDCRPADYAVDKEGSIHVVGVASDSESRKPFTYLLNYDSTGRLTGEHRLNPWVAADRVAMTPDGNLAVLGLDEDGIALQRRPGTRAEKNSKIRLVHLFSREGSWLRSMGAVDAPSDSKGWDSLRNALDHFFVVDAAGRMHFQLDRSCLLSLSPDGQVSQFEIPTAERQVRLVMTLVPSRNGLLVVLAEGQNQYDPETTRTTGLFAMEDPKEGVYLLEPDGLRVVRGDLLTRIIGQSDDGKWVKAKLTASRAVFFVEDEL